MPCAYVSHANPTVGEPLSGIRWLADAAVRALVEEADLTPKPGLVDTRGSGAHADMNLGMLHRSAYSLLVCSQQSRAGRSERRKISPYERAWLNLAAMASERCCE